jgi:hypothetical protein
MANKVESIPTALGRLRKGLIDEGYTADQAFWIVQDLIRKGDSVTALIED